MSGAGFSGAVRLADVSDFITPAQSCVVAAGGAAGGAMPAGAPSLDRAPPGETSGGGVVPGARRAKGSGGGPAVKLFPDLLLPAPLPVPLLPLPPPAPVRVTLYDCLACAGCVTSAEAVLLESQGEAELEALLARSGAWKEGGGARAGTDDPAAPAAPAPLVVLLTTQAAASFAAAAGVPVQAAAGAIAAALRAAGAAAVIDGGEPRAAALVVAAAEFCGRFAASPRGRAALAAHGRAGAGDAALAAAAALGLDYAATPAPPALPLLAGACPGWVCYAEKSAHAALPHLAAARSPQALAGALLKRWAAPPASPGARPTFLTISPCADKKLEALRDEFRAPGGEGGGGGDGQHGSTDSANSAPEVECVVTAVEAGRWLARAAPGWAAAAAAASPTLPPLDSLADLVGGVVVAGGGPPPPRQARPFLAAGGGGSGGWAAFVFRAAAASLFAASFPPGDAALPWVPGRNAHARDLILRAADGVPLLRVGLATGFRNIQALVRKGGRGGALPGGDPAPGDAPGDGTLPPLPPPHSLGPYDYVEVMACPGGCTNGGGQLREATGEAAAAAAEGAVAAGWEEGAGRVGEALLRQAVGQGAMPRSALWAGYQARGGEGGVAATVVTANNW
jgi:hypothetical protein